MGSTVRKYFKNENSTVSTPALWRSVADVMIWTFPDLDPTGLADDVTWRHAFADTKGSSVLSVSDFMKITLIYFFLT